MNRADLAVKAKAGFDSRRSSEVFTEAEPELKRIYLHPGDIYASPEPANLSIIVGSCVAVCLFDPGLSIGGATHYLLPTFEGQGQPSPRYGDVALKLLLDKLQESGSKSADMQAKVYGGACVLRAFQNGPMELIGDRNVRLALEVLTREKIPIIRQETGGENGRRISMRTDTGETSFKLIGN